MTRKIIIFAMVLAFAGPSAFVWGKKAEYYASWTYDKRTKTWKMVAKKKVTTSELIERLRKGRRR